MTGPGTRKKVTAHDTSPAILVVGASMGGLEALRSLVAQWPRDFHAAVFVVLHMSADASADVLVRALSAAGSLRCSLARDDEEFVASHIYVAPADHHLLVGARRMMVTKGARENRSRPGIDPLFRSAAVAHGSRVIGVLLSGQLDDGTAGLVAIKRCGGTCVVQSPEDAAYPAMPSSALLNAKVDHAVPITQMGALLSTLVRRPRRRSPPVPHDVAIEARIAERVLSDLPAVNCPGCGGVLWEVTAGDALRYRCHTGHAFTAAVLLAEQTSKIEETLWVALRMFEERRNLLSTIATTQRGVFAVSAGERAKESATHIERIRELLSDRGGGSRTSAGRTRKQVGSHRQGSRG